MNEKLLSAPAPVADITAGALPRLGQADFIQIDCKVRQGE